MMKVKRVRINNWKSFGYTEKPEWIEFKGLNIIIGPNSHGKTNFANALRVVIFERPDYGGVGRNRIERHDCNNPGKPITIDVDVELDDESEPVKLRNSYSYQAFDQRLRDGTLSTTQIRNGFFPQGTNRSMPQFGVQKAYGTESDNWELVRANWGEIRKDMANYFDVNLKDKRPSNQGTYLSDIIDDNGVPLNETGSGVMAALIFIMEMKVRPKCKVFLFEEPENHMHPELQRRFLRYLVRLTKEKHMQFFITTHSSILIDNSILPESDSAVFQVKKEENKSQIINVTKRKKVKWNLLYNQLGYKPSDILLSNTIIWVEGPTESIYLRKWIFDKNNALQEGRDYTIMFYGGSLLKHLSFNDDIDKFIELCTINVNSAILIDRDGEKLNETKQRVKRNFKEHDSIAWITEGREIENYINKSIFEKAVKNTHPIVGEKYSITSDDPLNDRTKLPNGKEIKKVNVALNVVNLYKGQNQPIHFDILDLDEQMNNLIGWIKSKSNSEN